MKRIDLSKDEISLICELLKSEITYLVRQLRVEEDDEQIHYICRRLANCLSLLGGLES